MKIVEYKKNCTMYKNKQIADDNAIKFTELWSVFIQEELLGENKLIHLVNLSEQTRHVLLESKLFDVFKGEMNHQEFNHTYFEFEEIHYKIIMFPEKQLFKITDFPTEHSMDESEMTCLISLLKKFPYDKAHSIRRELIRIHPKK